MQLGYIRPLSLGVGDLCGLISNPKDNMPDGLLFADSPWICF